MLVGNGILGAQQGLFSGRIGCGGLICGFPDLPLQLCLQLGPIAQEEETLDPGKQPSSDDALQAKQEQA